MPKSGTGHPGDGGIEGERDLPLWLSRHPEGGWLIRVKAVPGASRDEIVGPLGDRLKVRVAAAPEGGKANKAITSLLESSWRLPKGTIGLVAGSSSALKTFRIAADAGDPPRRA